jgi:hypothetical protein
MEESDYIWGSGTVYFFRYLLTFQKNQLILRNEALLQTPKNCIWNARNAENRFRWKCRGDRADLWVIISFLICGHFRWRCEHSGLSSTGHAENRSCRISHNLQRSPQSTIFEITCRLGLSYGSVQRILRENLNIRWIATKFVPPLLTDEEKQWRVWVSGIEGWSKERPTLSLQCCNRRRHLDLVLRHIN